MSADDKNLCVLFFQFALDTAKIQVVSLKMLIGEIEKMKSLDDFRRRLERLPDNDEKDSFRREIERAEFEFDSRILFADLKPLLKKAEEDQVGMAAILNVFKNGQSVDLPPKALPA